jgi:hypothetical protein
VGATTKKEEANHVAENGNSDEELDKKKKSQMRLYFPLPVTTLGKMTMPWFCMVGWLTARQRRTSPTGAKTYDRYDGTCSAY